MKQTFIAILVFTNICLIAANIYLVVTVRNSESTTQEKIQKLKSDVDAALSPQAITSRFGDEAGKSMEAFKTSVVAQYEELRAQAQKTADDLRAAAEPVIQDMKAKAAETGQSIGASTQSLGQTIEERSKELNQT